MSFSANWSWREVPFVWVITPAEGLMALPLKTISFGYEKLAWLKTLNISARNCKFNFSVTVNFLNSDVSNVARPGPRNDPRATLPKVPGAGIRKALGSNHWSGLPKITGPLKFGFQFGTSDWLESPVPDGLEPTSGVKGKPPCQLKIPFHCQPPANWFINPLAPPAKRCP